MKRDFWLYVIAAISGVLVWVVVSSLSGRREAWDSPAYFQIGIPVLCTMSAVMGYLSPDRAWRWGAIPLGAELLWMLATQGAGNLLPLGIIVGGILAIPSILTARLGAFIHRRTARQVG
jgi:hypothetical protein